MQHIKVDNIVGSRRISNYWWATVILIGGIFFFIGLSSYTNKPMLPLNYSSDIMFLPQGLVMTFYGTIAIIVGIFLWFTILLNIGSGYNEFNNDTGLITIFRLGFPGKNRILKLEYDIQDIKSIKVKIDEGLSPKREICLKTKDKREIPITKVGQLMTFKELEVKASDLARFLDVILESIEDEKK
uniref:Photosystem I assembly protein Ycf4 n=1 Tax=Sphondylothamnion multifidum TaxID=193186 RepID=A0A4D6WYJ3_9FLOR|nr:photosystem I assembly protein Ycf4 [Sphondylothamnion multifidum]